MTAKQKNRGIGSEVTVPVSRSLECPVLVSQHSANLFERSYSGAIN